MLTPTGKVLNYSRGSYTTNSALTTNDGQDWYPADIISPQHWADNTTPGTTNLEGAWLDAVKFAGELGNTQPDAIDSQATVDCLGEMIGIDSRRWIANIQGVRVINGSFEALDNGNWGTGHSMFYLNDGGSNDTRAERFTFEHCHFEGNHVAPGLVLMDNTKHRCGILHCSGHGPTEYGFRSTDKGSDLDIMGNRLCQYEFGENANWDDPAYRTAIMIDIQTTDSRIMFNTPFYCYLPMRCSGALMQIFGNHPFNGDFASQIGSEPTLCAEFDVSSALIEGNYFDNGIVRLHADFSGAIAYTGNIHIRNERGTFTDKFLELYAKDSVANADLMGLTVANNMFRELEGASGDGVVATDIGFTTEGTGSFNSELNWTVIGNYRSRTDGTSYNYPDQTKSHARGAPNLQIGNRFYIQDNGALQLFRFEVDNIGNVNIGRGQRSDGNMVGRLTWTGDNFGVVGNNGGTALDPDNGLWFDNVNRRWTLGYPADDKEVVGQTEGTWTVRLTDESGNQSVNSTTGIWTRIGDMVYCTFGGFGNVDTTGMVGSDLARITLPFPVANGDDWIGGVTPSSMASLTGNGSSVIAQAEGGTQYANIRNLDPLTFNPAQLVSDFDSGVSDIFTFSLTYKTSAA